MYQEHCTQGRHHEAQRSTVAGALIAISGGVMGLITYDKTIASTDLRLALFLFVLGAFGAVFSSKHYERFNLHMARARHHRDELDALLPGSPLKRLKKAADAQHNAEFPRLSVLRLNRFWLWFYVLLATIGAVLSIMSITAL